MSSSPTNGTVAKAAPGELPTEGRRFIPVVHTAGSLGAKQDMNKPVKNLDVSVSAGFDPLIAVIVGLERSLARNADILRLFFRKPRQVHPQLREVECCHLLV
jgi:hypothetical protein